MNKIEALDIIEKCAHQYDINLKDKNLMIITLEKNGSYSFIEAAFRDYNFIHLTGVTSSLNSIDFYKSCIDNMLSTNHFEFKNSTTELKLQVLNQAMLIDKTAKMIGEYNNNGFDLYSEKMIGNITVCMGLVKDKRNGYYYVPNTVLKADTRDKTIHPVLKIACVLKKPIQSEKYEMIATIGKKINLHDIKLPQEVIDKLSDTLKDRFGLPVAPPMPEETVTMSKSEMQQLTERAEKAEARADAAEARAAEAEAKADVAEAKVADAEDRAEKAEKIVERMKMVLNSDPKAKETFEIAFNEIKEREAADLREYKAIFKRHKKILASNKNVREMYQTAEEKYLENHEKAKPIDKEAPISEQLAAARKQRDELNAILKSDSNLYKAYKKAKHNINPNNPNL